jgi:hypothetical protein
MKNVLFLFAAFVLSLSANAQINKTKDTTNHAKMNDSSMRGCVMMKDGKMMMMKDGKMMDMDKDMTMSDGTVCMMDGTCKMKNGKTMKMKNGDKCYMDGKMGKMKMDKMAK